MNTTISSEHSWMKAGISRRSSMESILSIQSKETEFVRDTSDTDWTTSDPDFEYEPVTESEHEPELKAGYTSSDNNIIQTKVVDVIVRDEKDLEADSEQEQTPDDEVDSEIDRRDYWRCIKCDTKNNNPLYRYCEKCFKVRKSLFPPRPKRKHERTTTNVDVHAIPTVRRLVDHADSGVESIFNSQSSSQELNQDILTPPFSKGHDQTDVPGPSVPKKLNDRIDSLGKAKNVRVTANVIDNINIRKRSRADSVDRKNKRVKTEHTGSDTESDISDVIKLDDVNPLVKTMSDPSITIDYTTLTKKENSDNDKDNMCIVCLAEPKSGVIVHGPIAHICCCYRCAVKVWKKLKRCPVCNRKISNVLKAVFM